VVVGFSIMAGLLRLGISNSLRRKRLKLGSRTTMILSQRRAWQVQFARAAYGPDYDRLVVLKIKYDPMNFSRVNHNIKPTMQPAQARVGGERQAPNLVGVELALEGCPR
jgi:hypothetical protein